MMLMINSVNDDGVDSGVNDDDGVDYHNFYDGMMLMINSVNDDDQ